MKTTTHFAGLMILGLGLCAGCTQKPSAIWEALKDPATAAQLKAFVAEKEAQAAAASQAEGKKLLPEFEAFFAAAKKGDWLAVSNHFVDMRKRAHDFDHPGPSDERLSGAPWQAVKEVWGACGAFGTGDEKYCAAFGNDIIASIPPGSIYFGGTDPGRFIVTALQKSHVKADPFFTLTQNGLADSTYLAYLRGLFGAKIYTPTDDDVRICFQDYMADAQKRLQSHQLKPGEDVQMDGNGRITISGQVAVMEINGRLAKIIFDKNPDREFYIEASFPLDWMYPFLEPRGPILKVNRQLRPAVREDIVQQDRDYWMKLVQPMIGDWLQDDTPVGEIAAFVQKTFGKHDFSGFKGDPRFIQNAYAHKMFAKLRVSQAELYAWHRQQAADAVDKERMVRAADFALRQAWALCPYLPETVYRYVDLLLSQDRAADALLVAETAAQMPAMRGPEGEPLRALVKQLKTLQKAK
jgi:hypothetical protein